MIEIKLSFNSAGEAAEALAKLAGFGLSIPQSVAIAPVEAVAEKPKKGKPPAAEPVVVVTPLAAGETSATDAGTSSSSPATFTYDMLRKSVVGLCAARPDLKEVVLAVAGKHGAENFLKLTAEQWPQADADVRALAAANGVELA